MAFEECALSPLPASGDCQGRMLKVKYVRFKIRYILSPPDPPTVRGVLPRKIFLHICQLGPPSSLCSASRLRERMRRPWDPPTGAGAWGSSPSVPELQARSLLGVSGAPSVVWRWQWYLSHRNEMLRGVSIQSTKDRAWRMRQPNTCLSSLLISQVPFRCWWFVFYFYNAKQNTCVCMHNND